MTPDTTDALIAAMARFRRPAIALGDTGSRPAVGAFTLVELATVLAVLAILASLLWPTLVRYREEGRRASCRRNLSQVYAGAVLYGDSADTWLPAGVVSRRSLGTTADTLSDTSDQRTGWAILTQENGCVRMADASGCPSMDLNWRRYQSSGLTWCDYGYRLNAVAASSETGRAFLARHPQRALFSDATCFRGCALSPNRASYLPDPSTCRKWAHLEGGHIAAGDGHVTWFANRYNGFSRDVGWPSGSGFSCFARLDRLLAGE